MSSEALIAASGGSIHEYRKATRKMRWWYEALADFMIANPNATQNDVAAHFGRAVSTISTIVNTDAFTAYFRKRRDNHAEVLDTAVRSKLLKVADLSLDVMIDKLDKKRDTIPLDMLQRTTSETLKSLGYGVEKGPSTVINNAPQYVAVPIGVADLEAAREALRQSQMRTINATPIKDPE